MRLTAERPRERVLPPTQACSTCGRRHVLQGWPIWALFISAVFGFIAISTDVMIDGTLSLLDLDVAEWFHVHRTIGLTAAMQAATGLGSTSWVIGAALFVTLVLAWWRCWFGLLAFGLTVPGGMAVNSLLKYLFHRPRSGPEPWSASFSGYGFPSGHTMAAMLLYGTLTLWAIGAFATRREQVGAVFVACALVGLVGFSRLELGSHYLTDVLGAVAAGLAWLMLCFTAVGALRRRISG